MALCDEVAKLSRTIIIGKDGFLKNLVADIVVSEVNDSNGTIADYRPSTV